MMLSKIAQNLMATNTIAILSHVMPDGDSIGSTLALYSVLRRLGKKVDIYTNDKIPNQYTFLPNVSSYKCCNEYANSKYDTLIVLDCGSIDRTGECSNICNNSSLIINIDHHGTNAMFADLNHVDTNASATGELVFKLIKLMTVDILKDEALCLYTAILTDTGCFRYSNTSPTTHEIVGGLLNTGIDFGYVYDMVYKNYEFSTIRLMGKVLQSIELFSEGKIAYIELLKKDLDNLDYIDIDTSDFINYARDIKNVEVAVFVKEAREDEFKISLRSKKSVDVKSICEMFGGGGHVKAAGCTIKGSKTSIKNDVLYELEMALKE